MDPAPHLSSLHDPASAEVRIARLCERPAWGSGLVAQAVEPKFGGLEKKPATDFLPMRRMCVPMRGVRPHLSGSERHGRIRALPDFREWATYGPRRINFWALWIQNGMSDKMSALFEIKKENSGARTGERGSKPCRFLF
jgi:hypothetical protein